MKVKIKQLKIEDRVIFTGFFKANAAVDDFDNCS